VKGVGGQAYKRETMMQYIDFLRKVPLFAELEENDLEQLVGAVREHHYRKNATIFHIDDPGNAMFILKSGLVKVTIEDESGHEMILRMLYPTDFFGDMALIDGMSRSATVTTQEPSDTLMIHRDQFLLIAQQFPKILLNMAAVLSRRLRSTDELIRSLAFYDVYGKVARVLLNLAAERGRATEEGTVIDLRLTQQEMAELAGMSRETMTRTLGAFQQAGVVRVESGVITILSIDMLKREMRMA
jgi:CRP/FNR family transcriptional regulator, cyclic AMP receptor protein